MVRANRRTCGRRPTRGVSLGLAVLLLPAVACFGEPERPGTPTGPTVAPEVSGYYEAIHLVVDRNGSTTELVGEPDTRLYVQLNEDGTANGQLKIGTDPELRTKVALIGEWSFGVPNSVTFTFAEPTFLSEIVFQVVSDTRLTGEWLGDDVLVRVELQKID